MRTGKFQIDVNEANVEEYNSHNATLYPSSGVYSNRDSFLFVSKKHNLVYQLPFEMFGDMLTKVKDDETEEVKKTTGTVSEEFALKMLAITKAGVNQINFKDVEI